MEKTTASWERHPMLAFLSGALMLAGLGISLFGLSLPLIGLVTSATAQASVLPASSLASVMAQKAMLEYAGMLIAVGGVPIIIVGALLTWIVWYILP